MDLSPDGSIYSVTRAADTSGQPRKTSDGGVIYVSTGVDPIAPITIDVRFSDATVTYSLMGGP